MARIARRELRIHSLPLFTFGERTPWHSVADIHSNLTLRFFEPRYVELARRVLPPKGDGQFGYSENYPPKVGGAGVLAKVEEFEYISGIEKGHVMVKAWGARRFRLLALSDIAVGAEEPPLILAHVQLLDNRDVVRSPGMEGWAYWSLDIPSENNAEVGPRSARVKVGSSLVAQREVHVFKTVDSWTCTYNIPSGNVVVAAGPPKLVGGHLMVPILPSGAVELILFREA